MLKAKFTIEYDPATENLAEILSTTLKSMSTEVNTEEKPKAKSKKAAESKNSEAKAEEPKAEEKPEAPKDEAPTVTKSEIIARATQISKAGKEDVLIKIFAEFGAKKLSDIPADAYPELFKKLGEAIG